MPVIVALLHHWRPILHMVCLLLMQGIGFYMVFVYSASYLTEQMHVTTARALDINTLAMLAVAPLASIASDRFGRKPILCFVVAATFILAWPLWSLMHHQYFVLILTGQTGFGVLMGLAFGVTQAIMIEMLPTEVRLQWCSDRLQPLFWDVGRHDAVNRHVSAGPDSRRFRTSL